MQYPFDDLAKELAKGMSRREALRRVGGGLAGALFASLGLGTPATTATPGLKPPRCNQICLNTLARCQAVIQPNRVACENAAYANYLEARQGCGTDTICQTAAYNEGYVPAQQQCTATAYAEAQACNDAFAACAYCCRVYGTNFCP